MSLPRGRSASVSDGQRACPSPRSWHGGYSEVLLEVRDDVANAERPEEQKWRQRIPRIRERRRQEVDQAHGGQREREAALHAVVDEAGLPVRARPAPVPGDEW